MDYQPKSAFWACVLVTLARAYPYEVLQQQPLVHDEINQVPVLIWFDAATQTGKVYSRRVDEQVLTFCAG